MNNYLSIILLQIILLTSLINFNIQAQTTNQQNAMPNASDQKHLSIENYGIAINIPEEFIKTEPLFTQRKDSENTWTKNFLWQTWVLGDEKNQRFSNISVMVTNWDADVEKVMHLTLEKALANDYKDMVEEKRRKLPNGDKVEKVNYLEIDGVKGVFFQKRSGSLFTDKKSKKNQIIILLWKGYFYYQEHLQEIVVTVAGVRKDLQKLSDIINSIKLTK